MKYYEKLIIFIEKIKILLNFKNVNNNINKYIIK